MWVNGGMYTRPVSAAYLEFPPGPGGSSAIGMLMELGQKNLTNQVDTR
jgi:carboxypeptidase C (cathepsin A)